MNAKLEKSTGATMPCVHYIIDGNGNHWFCDMGVDSEKPLESQACTPAEDWIYDRNFGG